MAGIILRFSPASIIAAAWSARESEKQVRLGGIIPDEIHASDLSEARFSAKREVWRAALRAFDSSVCRKPLALQWM